MEIMAVQVDGGRTFRDDAAEIRARELVLAAIIDDSAPGSDLFLFPAGYFCVRERSAVEHLANRVHAMVTKLPRAPLVLFGIDLTLSGSKSAGGLRAFAVGAGGRLDGPLVFEQVSATASEAALASGTKPFDRQHRFVKVGRKNVAVRICGEVWSRSVRSSIASGRPGVVVDLAHQGNKTGAGTGSWDKPLGAIATASGALVVIAEHTRSPTRERVWPAAAARRVAKPAWIRPANAGVRVAPVTVGVR